MQHKVPNSFNKVHCGHFIRLPCQVLLANSFKTLRDVKNSSLNLKTSKEPRLDPGPAQICAGIGFCFIFKSYWIDIYQIIP